MKTTGYLQKPHATSQLTGWEVLAWNTAQMHQSPNYNRIHFRSFAAFKLPEAATFAIA